MHETTISNGTHLRSGIVGLQNFHGNVDHFAAETIRPTHHRAEVAFAQITAELEIAMFQHE